MKKTIYILLSVLLLFVCTQCGKKSTPVKPDLEALPPAFDITVGPFPPVDLPVGASDKQLVEFAWEEFFALNWQSSFTQNNLRDFPDTTWNFTKPDADLTVWETYAHRTEFRPASGVLQPFDNAPHYTYVTQPTQGTGNPSYNLFHNLDENNEIGSCELFAHVNEYGKEYMVVYQAKVNRDEYNYVQTNYNSIPGLKTARTTTKTNIKSDSAYYAGAQGTCDCPQAEGVFCLPCGDPAKPGIIQGQPYQVGAMEIKTAWRKLVPGEQPDSFFTRTVITYTENNGIISYINQTYALIGLHIIHKTNNYPDFVFATWEHVSVQSDNMGYVELSKPNSPVVANFPRLHPIDAITDSSTAYAHKLLRSLNPNSVWLNYRLVGVQATPSDNTNGFSFFLANYVVESDTTLGDFHGSGFANPHDGKPNTLLNKKFISQGGCQGCHGVAQMSGADFSFVSLTDNISSPDTTGSGTNKLQRLIMMTKR